LQKIEERISRISHREYAVGFGKLHFELTLFKLKENTSQSWNCLKRNPISFSSHLKKSTVIVATLYGFRGDDNSVDVRCKAEYPKTILVSPSQ
jgi:hypothetical protein